ncbi:uncharacterized protein B0I36DRAFT_322248 [Microdochium trichocladiopsis]|uniref:Uncharacterized protein n=1 Tax=Microdochium trichocladiopsis TaxID=1682393 RepID=A0A9P8Y6N5_9PEZI|nr:uncharacterized protein B0I36DRAFT_322248 [Microdochium trichocladiopsis]KAH7030683.1 hypothetical protein B0I36DRAFT_322248 [Microdochium trichocladiopsis]
MALDRVVAGHEGTWLSIADGELEGKGINLAQGTLCNDDVDSVALVLVVIADKVLDSRLDASGLDATDDGGSTQTSKEGVLADRLEATASSRCSLHVDGRPKDDVSTFSLGLVAHLGTGLLEQLRVPGRTEGGSAGEAGRGDSIEEFCASDTVGAV